MSTRHTIRHAQKGAFNVLIIPLVFIVLMLFGAVGFGYWAWTERQDYKANVDQKVTAAVGVAVNENSIKKDNEFAEREKNPLEVFDGPPAYGSVKIAYPKTWSVYVNSSSSSPQPLDAYFSPRVVPAINDASSVFSLRVKVLPTSYATVVKTMDNNIKNGKAKVAPFALEKVPEVIGIRADGEVVPGKKLSGSMVILPMRDKTLQVWIEDSQSLNDFNNIILKNMSFSP